MILPAAATAAAEQVHNEGETFICASEIINLVLRPSERGKKLKLVSQFEN
jgi:hypothetical protein